MPLSKKRTLTQYLIEQRRRFPQASGELNALILDVSIACKAIARQVALGALAEAPGGGRGRRRPERAGRGAEAAGHHQQPDADPADRVVGPPGGHGVRGDGRALPDPRSPMRAASTCWSSTRWTAAATSTSTCRSAASSRSCARRPRSSTAAATSPRPISCSPARPRWPPATRIYGPTTMLVLTVGNGVVGFTLDPGLGEFKLTHPDIRVPEDTQEFAINTSQQPLLGAAGEALRRRVPGRHRPARAARTSTCAGSPAWWPRRTAS